MRRCILFSAFRRYCCSFSMFRALPPVGNIKMVGFVVRSLGTYFAVRSVGTYHNVSMFRRYTG